MVFKPLMRITQLQRKRNLIYSKELTIESPGIPVFKGEVYEVFKLQIQRRDDDPGTGEVNFLIRNLTNNLRFLLAYCFMENSNEIHAISFWINSKVLLPSGEIANTGKLVDDENASYLLMDFIENYIVKNYKVVS